MRAGDAGVVADEGLVRADRARSARGSRAECGGCVPLRAQALARLDGPREARCRPWAGGAGVDAGFWLEEARCAGSAGVPVCGPARGARARVAVRRPRRLAGGEAAQERRQVQSLCEDRVGDGSQRARAESHAESYRAPEPHARTGLYSVCAKVFDACIAKNQTRVCTHTEKFLCNIY